MEISLAGSVAPTKFTKNLNPQTELNQSFSRFTEPSKSAVSRINDAELHFQETKSLEKIDPNDHVHGVSDD